MRRRGFRVRALVVSAELFVGVTTWNSAAFLPHCLASLRDSTEARQTRLVVLDNLSTDNTLEVARWFGAEIVSRHSGQAAGLADLFNLSRSPYTLLIHADVVFLDRRWFDLCASELKGNIALMSPEDIGCGPFTRPWGKQK